MKVIFLDIDGVLNVVNDNSISIEKIQLLSFIIKSTKADIVLSSSWRYGWNDPNQNIEGKRVFELKKLLYNNGITINNTIGLDSTKSIQIANYVKKSKPEKFVVVDDELIDSPNFIQINNESGLTKEYCNKIISILNT